MLGPPTTPRARWKTHQKGNISGVPLIDQLTHGLHRALLRGGKGGTVVGLAEAHNRSVTSSTVDLRAIALERPLGDLRVADFFAASN